MTNLEWMKLLTLAVKDLKEAVEVYEKAKSENRRTYAGYDVPKHCSKEAIKRRIKQIRQDLLELEKGL
jgi:hypothetical protein